MKKILSVILALALIMGCVSVCFTAFAEVTETYKVTASSPAIPMNENTKVNLASLSVQIDDKGTFVSGADITWSAESQDGIIFNPTAKTVVAVSKGIYKLTATANGVSKNIWVIVKGEQDEKFYLVDIPMFNDDSFVESDWRIFSSMNNTDVTVADAISAGIIGFADNYITLSHKYSETNGDLKKGSTIVYVNEIFKDFADYTIQASISSNGAATVDGVGAGVGGRVTLNEKETGYTTGILSYIRQTKVATITRTNFDFGPHGTAIAKDENNKYYTWAGLNDYHTIKNVYDGGKFSFYYDAESIYEIDTDTTNCTCTNSACIFKHDIPGAGYPAIVGFGAAIRVKNFSVYLNSSELAPASDVSLYTVSYGAPAIPMNENTAVDLNFINVEMDAEGTIATGNEIIWDAPVQEGLYLNSATKTVSVYSEGIYKLTATAKNKTKNVWIIAKKSTDEKFYLVDIPMFNDDSFVESDWRIFSSMNNTDVTVADAVSAGIIGFADNYITLSHKYSETNGDLKKGSTIVYVNEIFKDFADYTIQASISSNGAATVDGVGAGVGGRVTLNEKGTGYTTGILSYIRQTKVAAITRTNFDFGPHGTAIAKDENNKYYTWAGLNDYHTIKNVYDGGKFSFYYDAESIYEIDTDTTNCTCTNSACIFKHDIPGAGYPAIVGFGAAIRVKNFSVYLNSTEMPDATQAEEKPQEDIVITNSTIYASVNHYIDLADVVFNTETSTLSAAALSWPSVRTPNYELNGATKEFAAYQLGEFTETAIYNGQEFEITFVITDDETVEKPRETALVNIIGDATVNIKPTDGVDTEYTLTILPGDNKKLKVNSLKNGNTVLTENFDSTGRVYGFLADTPSEIYITAEYIEDNGQYNSAMLGATLNYEKSGIRFGARTDMVRKSRDANIGYLENKVLVDGKVYTPTEIGMLLIPSALFEGELTATTKHVQKAKINKAVNMTEAYSDIAITLINIPQKMYDTDISSRMYIAYDDGGVTKYIYGETIARSFNGINDSILEDIVPANIKLVGSTSNDYDDDPKTNSISYKTGDTITFEMSALYNDMPVNGIKLKWSIYQDGNATGMNKFDAVATGEGISLANEPLKISYTPKDTDKLKVDDGGYVYIVVAACDSNGKEYSQTKKFNGGAIYNADKLDASVVKDDAFDAFWQAQAADVEAFFTNEVKSDLNVTLDELNAGLELSYANGDKISIKPANSAVSGYSSYSANYYCYEIRIEYGSTTGRAASGFLAFPKSGSTYLKNISFAGYNTGSAGSLWSYANVAYLNSEAHGIAYDDPETSRKNYNANYNEPKFLFNYDNLSEEEVMQIAVYDSEFYHMFIRNFYMTRLLHHLKIEGKTYNGNFKSLGGSMGGLQNIVNASLDGMCEEQAITHVSINLAAWCVNMGGYTEGRITGWQPLSTRISNMCDPIHFAKYIRNVKFDADVGLGDTTSPITGNIALYNIIKNNQGVEALLKVNQNKTHGASDGLSPSFNIQNY